jgi:hypothetical protein
MARRWTTQELEFISDHLGFLHYSEIANQLEDRTTVAVKERARRSGMSLFDNPYTYTLLSQELGVSRNTLRKWHKSKLLSGKRASWRCKNGLAHAPPMLFKEEYIVTFLKGNASYFKGRRIPNPYFRNIVSSVLNNNGGKQVNDV